MFVTKSELAEHLKISRGRVSQLVGMGLPVRPFDDRVDLRDACQWVVRHLDPSARGAIAVRQAWQILDAMRLSRNRDALHEAIAKAWPS